MSIREFEKYIRKAKRIDVEFQRELHTKSSFLKEYHSLYSNKLIIDEYDLYGNALTDLHDYYEVLEYTISSYRSLLKEFGKEHNVTMEDAHRHILTSLFPINN